MSNLPTDGEDVMDEGNYTKSGGKHEKVSIHIGLVRAIFGCYYYYY